MSNLTVEKEIQKKDGKLIAFPVVANKKIFQGAIVKMSAAGFLDSATAEAGAVVAGIAYETIDNVGGANGAKDCRVETEGVFLLNGSGFAQADLGSPVYASDDQTISKVQGANEIEIGKIVGYVSASQVWVRVKSY